VVTIARYYLGNGNLEVSMSSPMLLLSTTASTIMTTNVWFNTVRISPRIIFNCGEGVQ
jgi:hypothetical protein